MADIDHVLQWCSMRQRQSRVFQSPPVFLDEVQSPAYEPVHCRCVRRVIVTTLSESYGLGHEITTR